MTDTMPRERLPETREGPTRKIRLGAHDFFARVGLYPDGRPGELFLTQSGESGTHAAVLLDGLAQAMSIALQHGAPMRTFAEHWRGTHAGDVCGTPCADDVASATSILDALARWFAQRWPEYATGASLPSPPVNSAACDAELNDLRAELAACEREMTEARRISEQRLLGWQGEQAKSDLALSEAALLRAALQTISIMAHQRGCLALVVLGSSEAATQPTRGTCSCHVGYAEYALSRSVAQSPATCEAQNDDLTARLAACERERDSLQERNNAMDKAIDEDGGTIIKLTADLALALSEAERLRGALNVAVAAIEHWEDADFNCGGGETHALHVARERLSAAGNSGRTALSPSSPAAPSSAAPSSEYRRGYAKAVEDAVAVVRDDGIGHSVIGDRLSFSIRSLLTTPASPPSTSSEYRRGYEEVRVVFDGPPGPESGRFVEVEDTDRHSIDAGEWVQRDDGLWELRIAIRSLLPAPEREETEDEDEVARVAAVSFLAFENHEGTSPVTWEILSPTERGAWLDVARAVLAATGRGGK